MFFFALGLAFPPQNGKATIQETDYENSVSLLRFKDPTDPCRGYNTF
ncbi:MAG: hypothetical protein LBE12_18265 [Planctomycetaceae bacterium]|nr:hypothetical protein [Planctomycetaceae bacterium]